MPASRSQCQIKKLQNIDRYVTWKLRLQGKLKKNSADSDRTEDCTLFIKWEHVAGIDESAVNNNFKIKCLSNEKCNVFSIYVTHK